jgi:hypothetical protein
MDRIATFVGVFWLFVVLNSVFIWNSYETAFKLCAYTGVLFVTFIYARKHALTIDGKTFSALFCIGLFFVWSLVVYSGNLNGYIFHLLISLSLFSIMVWPVEQYEKIYDWFRKGIIFFAVGSILVSLFTAVGLIHYIPYFELPPRSTLHEMQGVVYHVYGCIVTNYDGIDLFPRACGMLQEPGHFAIILGFVYMTDRMLGKKLSPWVVICGFLTFSSNFPLVIFITEIYQIFKIKSIFKILKGIVVALIACFIVFKCLSSDMQDTIKYLAYERNLETVVDALSTSGSLTEALDERTSSSGEVAYQNINSSNMWIGLGHDETLITLSDYRGVILQYGLIGLILIVIAITQVTRHFPKRQYFQMLAFLFLILIHRSWMFYAPYIYALPFMTSMLLQMKKEEAYVPDEEEVVVAVVE